MDPIRVLVVDDTAVVRRLVTDVLQEAEGIEVAGTASNGRHALQQIGLLRPDVVTLDVEMPVMDGLTTLAELRHRWPDLPVIMFSTLTARGASATLDALSLGANDYVTKPSATRNREAALEAVRDSLLPLVHLWGHRKHRATPGALPVPGRAVGPRPAGGRPAPGPAVGPKPPAPPVAPAAPSSAAPTAPSAPARPGSLAPRSGAPSPSRPAAHVARPASTAPAGAAAAAARTVPRSPVPLDRRPPLGVVIGISTGGPQALQRVIPMLPRTLSVPVVVVQHMPPVFTRLLAERLDASCVVPVRESEDGMVVEAGHVYIAAGGCHTRIAMEGGVLVLRLDDAPPENSCRPAVDFTMRSAHAVWGSRTLAVVMTGMGQDGLEGARLLRAAGGSVFVQDEPSSVVWGMPGAIEKDGIAERVLPLDDIAGAIVMATDRSFDLSRTGTR
ncbi:MAG: chemotaxis response regulator protein-glutamate methylesterase [Candidatus Nanopelagicales bacterium]